MRHAVTLKGYLLPGGRVVLSQHTNIYGRRFCAHRNARNNAHKCRYGEHVVTESENANLNGRCVFKLYLQS